MARDTITSKIKSQIMGTNGQSLYVIETLDRIKDQAEKHAGLVTVNLVTWQTPPKQIRTVVNLANVLALHDATEDILEQRQEQLRDMEAAALQHQEQQALAGRAGRGPIVPVR